MGTVMNGMDILIFTIFITPRSLLVGTPVLVCINDGEG